MTPTPQAIKNAARAMEEAEFDYHLKLVSLVDDVHTYSLIYNDGSEPLTFDDIDDAYAHIAAKKRQTQAKAALSCDLGDMVLVPKEPTEAMLEAAVVAGHQANKPFVERIKSRSFEAGMSSDITAGDGRIYRAAYRAMIAAAEGE